jgi:transcriptional regulator with XRE-family HTH domain
MSTTSSRPDIGALLREWRGRRRLTQLELALDAGISTRQPARIGRSITSR